MFRFTRLMVRKIKYGISHVIHRLEDSANYKINRKGIPTFYFWQTTNVGDILNPYLIEKITNQKPFLIKTRVKKHILPIGSILHFGTANSIVWGSGIIHPSQLPSQAILKEMQFVAVRGSLTQKELEKHNICIENLLLGDPAILLPHYYTPKKSKNSFKVGIVPHFVDASSPILTKYKHDKRILIIDVKQDPERFINEITSCQFILSSSLHGLILSDAYQIPNAWLKFSEGIIGGNFKFQDYYTTTTKSCPTSIEPIHVYNEATLDSIISKPDDFCEINDYIYNKQLLIDALTKAVQKI